MWRVGLALAVGLIGWTVTAANFPEDLPTRTIAWFVLADPLLALVSLVLLTVGRRRRPVAVPALVLLLAAFSAASAGAAAWAVGSVATRRSWRELALVAPMALASGLCAEYLYPATVDSYPWPLIALIGTLYLGIVVAVGMLVGSERARRAGLEERAETAEREQQARVEAAHAAERTRIAREMHDVLAHRMTLVAMHAGALSYRTDLSDEERATAASTIESNARLALQDLRNVLGALRADDGSSAAHPPSAPEAPQPRAGDIPLLVQQAGDSGMDVDLVTTASGEPGSVAGRTAYRVVQEALTNARKHAPGSAVEVSLSGDPAAGLTVTVTNPRHTQVAPALPSSGLGLLGLRERVGLAGGTLEHGPDADGGFTVRAWLPWAP